MEEEGSRWMRQAACLGFVHRANRWEKNRCRSPRKLKEAEGRRSVRREIVRRKSHRWRSQTHRRMVEGERHSQ
jgi:hypothetical protein